MALEKSLILLKPDAVQRRLCGEIITRLENKGLKLIAMKMLQVTKELAAQHYEEHVEKPFYPMLEEFITSGPVVAIVVEGPEAVSVVRGMMGKTNGRESAPGTIRGDFGLSRQVNLIHGSDGPEAALREIGIYFQAEEVLSYKSSLDEWVCASDEL
ncbi:nucleoside-diphosphate kinase [Thalassoglobus polymorphus]|uniref:Nucleoside diphosphate kinase n=1 Tax=Thalassoglobus polymorphus TaxID=2527994 RepID=A0A517QU38_9PLAN|nr:nucleoside-diphosphate kinase [Thalassoglobus polymorphus]QDT35067.1 Nucleoside diphosphate kinase [Thalassoglobus polymorphus]